jgi:hypothetical protein
MSPEELDTILREHIPQRLLLSHDIAESTVKLLRWGSALQTYDYLEVVNIPLKSHYKQTMMTEKVHFTIENLGTRLYYF